MTCATMITEELCDELFEKLCQKLCDELCDELYEEEGTERESSDLKQTNKVGGVSSAAFGDFTCFTEKSETVVSV